MYTVILNSRYSDTRESEIYIAKSDNDRIWVPIIVFKYSDLPNYCVKHKRKLIEWFNWKK